MRTFITTSSLNLAIALAQTKHPCAGLNILDHDGIMPIVEAEFSAVPSVLWSSHPGTVDAAVYYLASIWRAHFDGGPFRMGSLIILPNGTVEQPWAPTYMQSSPSSSRPEST